MGKDKVYIKEPVNLIEDDTLNIDLKTRRFAKKKEDAKAVYSSNNVLPQEELGASNREVEISKDYVDPYCISIRSDGHRCNGLAVDKNYCEVHSVKVGGIKSVPDSPTEFFKIRKQIKDVNFKMDEELSLLRALLDTLVYKYENEMISEYPIIQIIDQITKVQNYQAKFLPGKRPIDQDAILGLVNFLLNSLKTNKVDHLVIESVASEIETMLLSSSNDCQTLIHRVTEEEEEYRKYENK